MHGKNKFIESSKEIIEQIVAERKHGPRCPCNTCYIMEHEGADDAKAQLQGSFLVEITGASKSALPN